MPENYDHQSADQDNVHHRETGTDQMGFGLESAGPADMPPAYSAALLTDSRAGARGNAPTRAAALQRMQQTYGNRAVQRFLQRAAQGAAPAAPEEDLADKIQSRAGGGNSLDSGVQGQLESGLGADMSGVRVHTDGPADQMARSVDAVAFTTGSDIFFRAGAYNPGTPEGMHLLAHEATHTVQQAAGPVAGTPSAGGVAISDPGDSYEQAAEQAAQRVVSGGPAAPVAAGGGTAGAAVQRAAEEEDPTQKKPEEEAVQAMRPATYASIQREAATEEDPQKKPEEEKAAAAMQAMRPATYASIQREEAAEEDPQKKPEDETAAAG